MKDATAETEMNALNISHDVDSSSTNSDEHPDPKRVPLNDQYSDTDAKRQLFLPQHILGKKKCETEYHQGNASFGMSVFNLANAITGSGILGLSYAMATTGIALFVILLTVSAIFSLYSVHLLLMTAIEADTLVYEQLGYKAFGLPGKLAAFCSITTQNIGAISWYLYMVKYDLPVVIQALMGVSAEEWHLNGDYLMLLVTFTVILPLSLLRNLGDLGYTSGLSLLCMVFFLIVVIIKKFQIPCPLPEVVNALNSTLSHLNITAVDYSENICTPKYFIFTFETVYAFPILNFAFMCHPTILPMYKELKDRSRRKMQGVANVSFLAVFIMYLLVALFGYLTFNVFVEPELSYTYTRVYKSNVLMLIVHLAVLTALTLSVPVVLFPVRTSINQLLCASKDFSWIRHTVITVILLAGINALVIFVPAIRDICGFLGACAASLLIFILPSSFYIKLVKRESMKSVQKIMATAFLLCGFVVMIGSIILISLNVLSSLDGDPDGY